jgi:hypothetical protein
MSELAIQAQNGGEIVEDEEEFERQKRKPLLYAIGVLKPRVICILRARLTAKIT